MKSEPITVTITFPNETEAKDFVRFSGWSIHLEIAREAVELALKKRRALKREAKKAALVVERQGDTYSLNRDWK